MTQNSKAEDYDSDSIKILKGLEAVLGEILSRYQDVPPRADLEADCQESLSYWAAEGLIEPATG